MRKMSSLIALLMAACLMAVLFAACGEGGAAPCGGEQSDAPSLRIRVDGGQALPYLPAYNSWNGTAYDRPPTLTLYEEEFGLADLPRAGVGGEVTIKFNGRGPDTVELYLFTPYTNDEQRALPLHEESGAYSFTLPLGAVGASAREETVGFLLVCGWDWSEEYYNVCEYGFMLTVAQ